METSPLTLLHVRSCRYSGSTWLNLMLGAHTQILSIGEYDYALKGNRPICVQHADGCDLWGPYDRATDLQPLFDLSKRTGKRILALNNAPMAVEMAKQAGVPTRTLILLRDGRAVAASELRKNPGLSMRRAANRWSRRASELAVEMNQPENQTIRYESLCDDTPATLKEICSWLGLVYEERMSDSSASDGCFLGGNLGTHQGVAHRQGRELPDATLRDYARRDERAWEPARREGNASTTARDERWRSELSLVQRFTFACVAGSLNRRLGY